MDVALHFLPQSLVNGYSIEHVEVVDLKDLKRTLKEKGVIRCCRFSRCIGTDDGRSDGESVTVNQLTQDDLDWVVDDEPIRKRYFDCEPGRRLTAF